MISSIDVNQFVKGLLRARIAHFYDANVYEIKSKRLNKYYLILGDDKSIQDFQEQFHDPYPGWWLRNRAQSHAF